MNIIALREMKSSPFLRGWLKGQRLERVRRKARKREELMTLKILTH